MTESYSLLQTATATRTPPPIMDIKESGSPTLIQWTNNRSIRKGPDTPLCASAAGGLGPYDSLGGHTQSQQECEGETAL